ncbi:MAG: hypothetical protein JSR47_20090 [Proteobacteria bacterium]|nr:hypothetical protein [Pseudomonadota bacterium]
MSTALAPAARAGISCTGFYNGVQQCQVGLSTSVAERRAQRQRASQWCWAASLSMVFAYHGHAVSQERIVREAYGRLVDMPAQPQLMVAALNRTWRDDDDEDFTSRGDVFSANPMTAARDLAEDEPLIIGTSHHAMVLTALTYLRDQRGNGQVVAATVRDPWPDNPSRRAMSPQEWADVHFLARVRID